MSIYTDNSFVNRSHYLRHLSVEYDIDLQDVTLIAELLGEDEDFDGLISILEDQQDG